MSMRMRRPLSAATIRVRRVCLGAALALCGCGDVLTVDNPGTLPEERLADPSLEQFIVNGVIGEFQYAYGNYAVWSGVLADEMFADHPNVMYRDLSFHTFDDGNGMDSLVYASLQQTRRSAEDAVDRLGTMLGAKSSSSVNVARALIYGGYSYVLLGEGFCDSPVNLGPPLSTAELLARAIERFDEGIVVASAARSGSDSAAAKDLIALAHVGAARAALKRGDLAKARAHAALVTDTSYAHWAYYSANSVRENNAVQFGVRQSLPFLGAQPLFQTLRDPRVPLPAVSRPSLRSNQIFPPLRPFMYSGWSSTAPVPIDVSTHVRFASALEARYIAIEVDGSNAAMLSFVNARRAVGGAPPVSLTGSALVTEFRVQRALDFYLTGQRLGDLRRYLASGTDLFPKGRIPFAPDNYGTMHCFVVPRSEKAGNPNY